MSLHNLPSGSPFQRTVPAVPSDSVDLEQPARGLIVEATGNVSFQTPFTEGADTTISLVGVAAGYIYPGIVTRVNSTGTAVNVKLGY